MHSVGQIQLQTASSVGERKPAKFYFYVAVNCPEFLFLFSQYWQTVHAVHHVVVEKCMQIVSDARKRCRNAVRCFDFCGCWCRNRCIVDFPVCFRRYRWVDIYRWDASGTALSVEDATFCYLISWRRDGTHQRFHIPLPCGERCSSGATRQLHSMLAATRTACVRYAVRCACIITSYYYYRYYLCSRIGSARRDHGLSLYRMDARRKNTLVLFC